MIHTEVTQSWSGEGVGTSLESFLASIEQQLPEYSPRESSEAVVGALCERLPGGLVRELREQFPSDLREFFASYWKEPSAPASTFDKDDFYLDVGERLQVDVESVRLVLHVVFAALHSQITERLAERIGREMPPNVVGTWDAARRDANLPR